MNLQLKNDGNRATENRRLHLFADTARLTLPFLVLVALSLVWKFIDPLFTDRLTNFLQAIPHAPWAIVVVIPVYCLLSLFVFPISILLYGTILTFGLFPGVLYAIAGTMTAAMLNYYQGKLFSQKHVYRFLESRKLSDLKEALQTPGLTTIMVIRLTPLAPFTIENYLAGAVGVGTRNYALGTFLGLMPGILCIGLITTALRPYVQNPLYYIPIYFGMSSVLLLLVLSGKKIAGSIARQRLQKRFGSIIYTRLDQIKGLGAYFAGEPWLASYINHISQGCEGQNFFVKVGTPQGNDTLMLFQLITVTPKDLLSYVKSKRSLGKNLVRQILGRLLQKRRIKILVNGCPNLTGDFRFVDKPADLNEADATMAALRQLQHVVDYDAVIIKDIAEPWKKRIPEYKTFQVDPNMVVLNQWETNDEYVSAMRTKYRQRYLSTMKKSSAIAVEKLGFLQIVEQKSQINALFRNIVKTDKFNLEQISEDYFMRLAQTPEFSLYGYYLDGRLVAFRSSLAAGEKLIAHYVGYDEAANGEYKIYQRMLYDYVAEGIGGKFCDIHLGRTALEIKSTVGAEREDYSLLFHSDNWFYRTAGNYYVGRLKATSFEARSPFRDGE